MKTPSLLLIGLSLFFHNLSVSGQQFNVDPDLRPFQMQVKQFSEFIDRFNYKTDPKGNPIDDSFKKNISRKDYILSLFDHENEQWKDEACQKRIEEFIDSVVANNVKIFKYSEKISACATTQILRDGKPNTIQIILHQEIVDGKALKWSIANIKNSPYKLAPTNGETFIQPTNHETNFSKLQKLKKGDSLIANYAGRDFQFSPLSVFLFEIYDGRTKIVNVEEITYFILDIDGYKIQVKYFNRNTDNSGWLIHKLSMTNK